MLLRLLYFSFVAEIGHFALGNMANCTRTAESRCVLSREDDVSFFHISFAAKLRSVLANRDLNVRPARYGKEAFRVFTAAVGPICGRA